jgi:conjugative transfer region protein TrbK
MRRLRLSPDGMHAPKPRPVLVVLAAGALIAGTAAWLAGVDGDAPTHRVVPNATTTDPLRAELDRCNGLGQAALADAACRAAWAENRRRFFGTRNTPGEPRR